MCVSFFFGVLGGWDDWCLFSGVLELSCGWECCAQGRHVFKAGDIFGGSIYGTVLWFFLYLEDGEGLSLNAIS